MRKTLTALSIAAALFAGQAMAGQETLSSLQSCAVSLSAEQSAAIANAQDSQQLVDAIASLITAQPSMAANIVAASVRTNPSLAGVIQNTAIQAAPAQEQAINSAVVASNEVCSPIGKGSNLINGGASVPTSSVPSIGGSGGGSTSLASPN